MTTLVVTDLDGTLWDNTLRCHPDTIAAVNVLLERDDVELLVATGRRRNSARRGMHANGIELPAVLLNGAIGFDFGAETIFHQSTFDPAALGTVAQVLSSHDLAPIAYLSDTRALAIEGVTTSEKHLGTLEADLHWATYDDLVDRTDVLGMSMLGIDWDLVNPALPALQALPGLEVAAFGDHLYPPCSVMLAPDGIDKTVGIRAYLDYTGLQPSRIIALGDAGNDLQMMAMADFAIAVDNGDPRVIELADTTIRPPQHGGWAAVIGYLD